MSRSRTAEAIETLVAGLVDRAEAAEARAAAAEAAAGRAAVMTVGSPLTEADDPNHGRTAEAIETLVAGLVDRAEAAEARAAAAEAAAGQPR